MLRKLFALLIVALAAVPLSLQAQTFSTPVRVNSMTGMDDHSPAMQVGRDGTVYVSWFVGSADIYFAHSNDGGATFSNAVRASKQVTTNSYTSLLQRVPNFAIDSKGVIHMVWTEDRINAQSDVFYIRSNDKGVTWSAPVAIQGMSDSSKYAQDFSAIAIDSSDNLYVSFLDFSDQARGTSEYPHMHLVRSFDHGATWSEPFATDYFPGGVGGTCDCCRQDIAASPEGHIYIAFRSNVTNKRDVWISRSYDQGSSFGRAIKAQLGDWNIDACPTTGPHITLDRNEDLALSWRDARDDSARSIAYFSLLHKYDSAVHPNRSISRASGQIPNWPSLALAGRTVGYAYMNVSSNQPIRFSYSSDGGNSWTRDMPFPGNVSDNQQLPLLQPASDGSIYAVWQGSSDRGDIYFSKISGFEQSALLSKPIISLPAVVNAKEPFVIRWQAPTSLPSKEFVWYKVGIYEGGSYNITTTRDTQFAVPGLLADSYRISVIAYTMTDSSEATQNLEVASLGVREGKATPSVTVYPNPARKGEAFTVVLPMEMLNATVMMYDSKGAKINGVPESISGNTLRIVSTSLAAGVYRIVVRSGAKSYATSVTIE